jgi:V/A-type H+-transporting ATPase subunit I
MIEKMRKYTFILHHADYTGFLTELQKLGMVHIVKSTREKSEKLIETHQEIEAYTNAIRLFKKYLTDKSVRKETSMQALEIRNAMDKAHAEKERLFVQYTVLSKDLHDLEPWGNFSYDMLKNLNKYGLQVDLYSCSKHHFKEVWKQKYTLQVISENGPMIYFTVLHNADEPVQIDADLFRLPPLTLAEVRMKETEASEGLKVIEEFYADNALVGIELFTDKIKKLAHQYEYEEASLQSVPEADNNVMIMQGWIPNRIENELIDFLKDKNLVYFAIDGVVEDNPPILLKNNWFAKIFEPIGAMFMPPYYNELDLTPFFAPFYMLFFGFCAGDSGYGIILFLVGWLLKKKFKNKPEMFPFLTLIQALGIGTIIMGFVMGSFFSFDMKAIPFLNPFIAIRDTNQIFNFALLLGLIQILVGKVVNAAKQMIQSGFMHGMSTIGMAIFILCIGITGSTMLGAKPGAILKYTPYGIYLGLAMIFLLNTPGKSILFNLANGIWLMYGVITGFFGDILSYIRLFALGVSGGILGLVINSMAAQFGQFPVIGPVIFILLMVGGHSLNIALCSIGAFVHPMRLTFVEFFNNSGFSGPGMPYKPFGKKLLIK